MSELKVKAHSYQILFAFFVDNLIFKGNNKALFLSNLKGKGDFLGSNETLLPIPEDAPPEIPRMFLSKPGEYEIKFMRNRIDYTLTCWVNDPNEICNKVTKLYSSLQENLENLFVKDVGIIVYSFFDNIDGNEVNNKLSKLFGETGNSVFDIKNSVEFSLRNLNKKSVYIDNNNIDLNVIVNLNSVFRMMNVNERKIVIDVDVNTFPAMKKIIDRNFLDSFIQEAFSQKEKLVEHLIGSILK